MFWSFNLFGQESENSLPPQVTSGADQSVLVDVLRQRLMLFAKEYCRWGLHVTPRNIFCTSQSLFIQTVYDVFSLLYSNKLLFKEFSPQFYSIKFQRFVDLGEIRISFEKTESSVVVATVVDIPTDSQLNDVLEDELVLNSSSVDDGEGSNGVTVRGFGDFRLVRVQNQRDRQIEICA